MTKTVEIICNAIEYVNDQLKAIAKWPNLQRQDACASSTEVVRQLQRILKLSTYDRVHLMWIIMCNVDESILTGTR